MLLTLASLCLADDAAVQHHLEQARVFFKKQWYADAAAELETGLAANPDAAELWWLAAQVALARLHAEEAIYYATGAIATAPTASRRDEAIAFRDRLRQNFGFIDIESGRAGLKKKLTLTPSFLQLDPELAAWTSQVQAEVAKGLELPAELSLPVGSYSLGGQTVEVRAGLHQELRLGTPDKAPPWLDLGLGLAAGGSGWPGPELGVAIGLPLRWLWLNLGGSWGPAVYASPTGGPVYDLRAGGPVVGLGTDLVHLGVLRLHPSVKLGLLWVPGRPVSCSGGHCVQGWEEAELRLGLLSPALAPMLSLALLQPVGDRLRVGLAAEAGVLVGQLPPSGEATGAEGTYSWTIADRGWLGWRSSLRVQLSFALLE
ncbi:MAG TPA: tetratricopeptide repeat protein [Myxococcota bacterium]|nr:tetratricopeptide repeat protein [Myxococcota bacterium]